MSLPFEVSVGGIVREFELYLPEGWEHWIEELYDSGSGPDGLPLVIALHGRGQDPKVLLNQWPFHEVMNQDDDPTNKFVLLVPYGFARHDPDPPGVQPAKPGRGWNAGLSGASTPQINDRAFIDAAITASETYIQERLDALGSSRRVFDPDRIYVFGYSNGGMMAFRLANEKVDYFAALWVMAGSYGGKAYNSQTSTVENDPNPSTGSKGISLMLHHGEDDLTIPPGSTSDVTGTNLSEKILNDLMSDGHITVQTEAEAITPALRTVAGAADAFVSYNNSIFGTFPTSPSSTNPSASDLLGGTNATDDRYERSAPNDNPLVRVYRDGEMDHTNFASSANRYFQPWHVWYFFKTHPRV